MTTKTSSGALGPALVIGGCGFVGSHIVNAPLKDPTCGPVSGISRNPNVNRYEGLVYHTIDVCNLDKIQKSLPLLKPRVIFHAAAPCAADPTIKASEHYKINVDGRKNLLTCAKESSTVKSLVYTSTCSVLKGYQHFNIDKTALQSPKLSPII